MRVSILDTRKKKKKGVVARIFLATTLIMQKIYCLTKDLYNVKTIQDSIKLRTNNYQFVGYNENTSVGYSEILSIRPDIVVVDYPADFTAKQLIDAMKAVGNVTIVALIDNPQIKGELESVGIKYIMTKPINGEAFFDLFTTNNSNPFISNNSPFTAGQSNNANPFANSNVNRNSNNNGINPFNNMNSVNSFNNNMNTRTGNGSPNNALSNRLGNNNGLQDDLKAPTNSIGIGKKLTIKQKLVSLHCSKGGVGKTTLAINLAVLLSTVKVGEEPLKVLLVDMDWAFGDICTDLFKFAPSPTIMDWAEDIDNKLKMNIGNSSAIKYSQEQIEQYLITYEKTGLYILAAPADHNAFLNIENKGQVAEIVIRNLRENCNFDLILFDCGNNLEDHTVQALNLSDEIYEITTMDVSTISEIVKTKATFQSAGLPLNKIKLVFNKFPKSGADFKKEDVTETIGIPLVSTIGDHPETRTSHNNAMPLVLQGSAQEFRNEIQQLANNVMGNDFFGKNRSKNLSYQEPKKGLFARLFGK